MIAALRAASCALALAAAGCGAVDQEPTPANVLDPVELDLPEGAFFGDADLTDSEIRLEESTFDGVALFAPEAVDTKRRSTLPVLVASRIDGRDAWDVPLAEDAVLVAVEVESGVEHSAPAFGSAKQEDPAERPPRPSDEELAGFGAELVRIDARAVLDLPWQRGVWEITLVYDGRRSTPVRVTLGPDL